MASHDPSVARQQADKARVLALGNSARGESARELLPFLKSPFSEVRRLAASGLRKLASHQPDATCVVPGLAPLALHDPHPQVQQYAIKALAAYPKEARLFLEDLKDLARNPTLKDYVRTAASEAVAAITSYWQNRYAQLYHSCSRCQGRISEEEHAIAMRRYGLPYCRHCLDEKQLEDQNFEQTVESAKRRRTEDGTVVQSKGEKRIADYLAAKHITYLYDERIRIAGDARIRPDFYLPEFDIYIEYWGMNTPEYNENKLRKRILYQRASKKLISLSYRDFDQLESILDEKLSRYIRL